MPQIREYLPEENASGPQGATSPNLEAVTAMGRGIETLGRDVGAGAEALYTRHAQLEQADNYAAVMQKRADMTLDMQDKASRGEFDLNQMRSEFSEWADKNGAKDTTVGKASWEKQTNRLLESMIVHGYRISTAQSHAQAVDKFM